MTTDSSGNDAQKASLRPVLRLSDSFCKAYGLVNKGSDVKRPGTKVKEINVYEVRVTLPRISVSIVTDFRTHIVLNSEVQVAIRYSSKLTKDSVFTGLKDLFQCIGDHMLRS